MTERKILLRVLPEDEKGSALLKWSDYSGDLVRGYKLGGSTVPKELSVIGGKQCDIIIVSIADSESIEKEIFLQIPLIEINDLLLATQAHITHKNNEMSSGTISAIVSERKEFKRTQDSNEGAKDEAGDFVILEDETNIGDGEGEYHGDEENDSKDPFADIDGPRVHSPEPKFVIKFNIDPPQKSLAKQLVYCNITKSEEVRSLSTTHAQWPFFMAPPASVVNSDSVYGSDRAYIYTLLFHPSVFVAIDDKIDAIDLMCKRIGRKLEAMFEIKLRVDEYEIDTELFRGVVRAIPKSILKSSVQLGASKDTQRDDRKAVPYVALVSVSVTALPKAPERQSARPSTIDVATGAVLLSVRRRQIYAVCARYINADQEVWLRIPEGWIPERLSMEQHNSTDKIFEVAKVGKRIDEVSIRSMKFNEKITKGKAVLKISLDIDVVYDKNLVLTLSRSTAQFLSLKSAIGASQLKSVYAAKKIAYFPSVKTGPQVLTNPFLLLDLQTGLEAWLKLLVPTIDVIKSGFIDYIDFITPTVEDVEKIENELTSPNGFRGEWNPKADQDGLDGGERSAGIAASGGDNSSHPGVTSLGQASHADATRVGPLLKRGSVGGPFKRNRSVYAVVSNSLLTLYNSAESVGNEDAIGFVQLERSKVLDSKDATIVILGVFEGKSSKEKDLHLTAAGSQEAESWRNSIRLNISSSKEGAPSGSAGAPTARSSVSVSTAVSSLKNGKAFGGFLFRKIATAPLSARQVVYILLDTGLLTVFEDKAPNNSGDGVRPVGYLKLRQGKLTGSPDETELLIQGIFEPADGVGRADSSGLCFNVANSTDAAAWRSAIRSHILISQAA